MKVEEEMVDPSDLTRQYVSSLSILVVSLFVGVPIWWKTTEVYRCPLPYKEISGLGNKHVSVCNFIPLMRLLECYVDSRCLL